MDRPLDEAVMDVISVDDSAGVDRLIRQGVDLADRFGGETLLGWAAMHGLPVLAQRLIEAGAPIAKANASNTTPLSWAASIGTEATVAALLEAGADPNAASDEGLTALMMAAKFGHIAVVRRLLAHGAELELPDNNELTALSWAVSWADNLLVTSSLLDAGANATRRDVFGFTALDRARAMGFAMSASLLRDQCNEDD
jgi:ankyrin repeat protein